MESAWYTVKVKYNIQSKSCGFNALRKLGFKNII